MAGLCYHVDIIPSNVAIRQARRRTLDCIILLKQQAIIYEREHNALLQQSDIHTKYTTVF